MSDKAKKLIVANQNNNPLVVCPFEDCGYTWEYSGKMNRATCPSCLRKVVVKDNKVQE